MIGLALSLASQLPQFFVLTAIFENATDPVKAGLPAMAVGQAMMMLTERTASLASQLPHFIWPSSNAAFTEDSLWELAC